MEGCKSELRQVLAGAYPVPDQSGIMIFNPPSRSASADEKMWFNSPTLGSEKGSRACPGV
jgi:hypothetical protein